MIAADNAKDEELRAAAARRMGPAGSPAWHAILDGAEAILRDEGYAALNAKRIAERIGIKRQLVYYYFRDRDDLLVQLFHRIADHALERLRQALASDTPLGTTWDIGIATFDQTLLWEFMALANRNPQVRKAMLGYASEARRIQVAALGKAFAHRPMAAVSVPYPVLAIIATWLSLGLQREEMLGIVEGHVEAQALIGEFLAQSRG